MPKNDRPKRQPTGDYPVGYCRPPQSSRFLPGQSGNPGGQRRRDVSRTAEELLRRELSKKITITIDGREQRVTKLEAIMIRQINDLIGGSEALRHRAFVRFKELGVFDPTPESMRPDPLRFRKFVERLAEEARRHEGGE